MEITSNNKNNLEKVTKLITTKLENMDGIEEVDNTMPLPVLNG